MTYSGAPSQFASVRAVLFDVYRTLVEITNKRAPFKQLLRIGEQQGRPASPSDTVEIMSTPLGLRDAAERLGIHLSSAQAAQLEMDMDTELASVRLFSETLEVLHELKQRGFKLGICSNLAADYARPVSTLLRGQLDALVWSFEAGAIKPDPSIYARSCHALDRVPAEVLMVGDTFAADVVGPRACGMYALLLLRRARERLSEGPLASLTELLSILSNERPHRAERGAM